VIADSSETILASVTSRRSAIGKEIVDKHRAVTHHAIVSYLNEITDECVTLDPAALTDNGTRLYLNEWPDKRSVTYSASVQVDRLHYRYVSAKVDVLYGD
jgi:hypothetical protein